MGTKKHNDPNLVKFGQTVQRLRKAKTISQEDLAGRAGLHRNYVGALERGERNVGLLALLKLAVGLEIKPSLLLHPFDKESDDANQHDEDEQIT